MLLLLLLLPLGAFACIPMKTIDRGIPAVPGGGGPAAQVTGCKLGAVKKISQADLDTRYCTGANPAMPAGCAAGQGCVPATITATMVSCPASAPNLVYQQPNGSVNGGPFPEAECVNEMWALTGGPFPSTGMWPYINACCFA